MLHSQNLVLQLKTDSSARHNNTAVVTYAQPNTGWYTYDCMCISNPILCVSTMCFMKSAQNMDAYSAGGSAELLPTDSAGSGALAL